MLDTGSMVSIVTRDFFENCVQPRGWELKKDISLKLTAANGLSLPYDGYFISDVTIFGTSVKDRVFLVLKEELKRPSEPCIIGMNILQEISPWSEILNTDSSTSSLPQRTQLPPVGKYVRVARDSCIPPSTVLAVSVTGPHPSAAGQFIVEPLPVLIKGAVFAVPVRVEASAGRLTTLLVNAGDTATVLRRNTVVGLLSKEDPCLNLAATSYGIDVTLSDTADIGGCPAPPSQALEAMIAGCVTGSHRVDLRHLLAEHNDLFAWSEMDLGYTDKVHHRIPVTTDVPVSQPYRRLPPKQFEEVRQHLKGLMERGVIRESTSPYSSPIVLVRKSNGDLRMCIDYRRLNALTRKDAFPLPRIDESLDALGGARIFSTLDLACGYHQVAMAEEDKSKTAFTTPLGLLSSIECLSD